MSTSTSNNEGSKSSKVFRIGMVGGGTVGGGVYDIITKNEQFLKRLESSSVRIEVSKICVRDTNKKRDFEINPDVTSITSNFEDDILNNPDIDCIVEVMGGTGVAKKVVLDGMKAGKSVVTANKALLAEYLEEVEGVVKESKVMLAYEASVCGGIPIIQILQNCYVGDNITQIMGICNGTTNYMLGKMETGSNYDEVLAEAQALGFAEADPSADVEGHDVRAKIAIFAKLAFGMTIAPVTTIPCVGISSITTTDFESARELDCTVKLIGTAKKWSNKDGKEVLSIYVTPKMVSLKDALATATGCGNIVSIESSNLGSSSYSGPGAGRYPTANSVVSDIFRVATNLCDPNPFPISTTTAELPLDHDYLSSFYIRFTTEQSIFDMKDSIKKDAELNHNIQISRFLPPGTHDPNGVVFTTKECLASQIQTFCDSMVSKYGAKGPPFYMPIL